MASTAQASAKTSPGIMVLFSPKRGRILSAKSGEGALLDLLDRAEAGDPAELRRAGFTRRAPACVVTDERTGLLAVHLEAMPHGFFAVVVALHQRLAGDVVVAFALRRVELHVIGAPGGRMHAPPAHALDDLAVRHIDLEHVVDRHAGLLHRLGLRDGARKAVEQIAALAVEVLQPLVDQTD